VIVTRLLSCVGIGSFCALFLLFTQVYGFLEALIWAALYLVLLVMDAFNIFSIEECDE